MMLAAFSSLKVPCLRISSKSSPPLQILMGEGLSLLSNDVISLFVLEVFIHLDDVRVVQLGEDVDLVCKHPFILGGHV